MEGRLRIGLTGGIASGKSTVAERFTELGVPVIDADVAARVVVEPGKPALAEVIKRFGTGVVDKHGELDRRALRTLVFADPGLRRDLESILHPRIRAYMEESAAAAIGPYVVMAIPLLVEAGSRSQVDRILVVDVDESVQLRRLVARDVISMEQARSILASQATRSARLAAADDVLPNAGSIMDLRRHVDVLHTRYLQLRDGDPKRDLTAT
jgi:dephospho-CoA kinase